MAKEDYIISIFRKDDCKRLIRRELNAIPETATIRDAITALRDQLSGYVCVLDEKGKLLGIITERHILRCFGQSEHNENDLATLIMTKEYETIECRDSIAAIALTLYKNTFMHLPILEDGKLIGVVSARDFISYLIEFFAETVYNVLPGQPTQDQREGA